MSNNRETVTKWLSNHIVQLLNINSEDINPDTNFENYGLQSADIMAIMADLEDWLGVELEDPVMMYEYPTINQLADYLLENYNSNISD